MTKELEKKQTSNNGSICKLTLAGSEPTGKLLCCENDNSCIASPMSCSSTSKLWQCWNINQLDACARTDANAQIVCLHKDGVYC